MGGELITHLGYGLPMFDASAQTNSRIELSRYQLIFTSMQGEIAMTRIYFIVPTFDSAESIADELRHLGVTDGHLHIVSRDARAEQKSHVHRANTFCTSDCCHMAKQGLLAGFLFGVGFVFLTSTGGVIALATLAQSSLIGAVVGGLICASIGIGREEINIEEHQAELNAGKHMLLADVETAKQHELLEVIHDHHGEARTETTHASLHF